VCSSDLGRRYRRQDEVGTPFCVTIDGETLKNDVVTGAIKGQGWGVMATQMFFFAWFAFVAAAAFAAYALQYMVVDYYRKS
jgi:POT family proton-dependent oligopeptide transporter